MILRKLLVPKTWDLSFSTHFIILLLISEINLVNCFQPISSPLQQQVSFSNEFETNNNSSQKSEIFWDGVRGEEYIEKLNWFDLEKFNEENSDTFIMFYANWCKASKEAKEEFAKTAHEIAYTEGFSHIHFGAFDCNATLENKRVCNKRLNIIYYPRFLYFKNGEKDRMYTVKCPRYTEFFYNWIVDKGNGKYCSGTLSPAMITSAASSHLIINAVEMVCYVVTFCAAVLFYDISKKLD